MQLELDRITALYTLRGQIENNLNKLWNDSTANINYVVSETSFQLLKKTFSSIGKSLESLNQQKPMLELLYAKYSGLAEGKLKKGGRPHKVAVA